MPRQTYSIRKTPAGKWQARYRDSSGKQRSKNFDRQIDARNFLEDVRPTVRHGTYIDPAAGRERVVEYGKRWAAGRDWKETTRQSFDPHLRRIEKHLGNPMLDSVDRLDIEAFRQSLADADFARSTVGISLHYLKAIMQSAFNDGLIARDPTIGVYAPRRRAGDRSGIVGPEDVPTRAEALAILEAAPAQYRAAIALGMTGLRIGEVLGVRADALDLPKRKLLIDQQIQYVHNEIVLTTPKREKVRTITLPALAVLELRRHLRDHQGAGLLFRGLRGAPMMRRDQFYSSAWRPALIGAGLEPDRFKFHSLRHFAASAMLAHGGSHAAVAGHLGDTVETITRTYVHWLRDDQDVPATILDAVFSHEESTPLVADVD